MSKDNVLDTSTEEIRPQPRETLKIRDRIILVVLTGLVTCLLSIYISSLIGGNAGDLRYSIWLARDWFAGKDPYLPYKLNTDPLAVPYPFTAVLLTAPLAWLPDRIAAGIFIGIGSGLLAWLIMAQGKVWRLSIFLSWPFINNLIFTQWAPYAVSLFFTPSFLPLLFTKPQLALPFALTQKPNKIGILLSSILVLLSLVLFPAWPVEWLSTLRNFIGYPPLITLPFGPLIFLALFRYRDRRSWLLVLLAAMPQRMVYDQLGVLLVAENRKQIIFLILCSWLSFPALLYFHGWDNLPYSWQQWVLFASYLPGLVVILWPVICNSIKKIWPRRIVSNK